MFRVVSFCWFFCPQNTESISEFDDQTMDSITENSEIIEVIETVEDMPTEKSRLDFGPWEQITDLSGCCRLCLTQSDGCGLTEIFIGTSDKVESWKHRIISLIPIQLELVEGLPHGICANCVESLSQAQAFISLSVSVDAWLRKRMGLSTVKGECVDSDVEIIQNMEKDPLSIEPSRDEPTEQAGELANAVILPEKTAYPSADQENIEIADHHLAFLEGHAEHDKNSEEPGSSKFFEEHEDTEFIECKPGLDMVRAEGMEGQPMIPEHIVAECDGDIWPEETTTTNDDGDFFGTNPSGDNVEEVNSPAILICAVCCKTFTNEKSLKRHLRYHNESSRFPCDTCPMAFSNQMGLVEHYRTHTGDRPYECSKCPKTFAIQSSLKKHERTHTGERPYTCKVCSKTFSNLCVLRTHERIHTGEKPYGCNFCFKLFTTHTALKKHIRVHTGEKPFPCSYCPMQFTEGSKRNLHERRKHAHVRTVKCTMCEEFFVDIEHQARHIAEVHEDT